MSGQWRHKGIRVVWLVLLVAGLGLQVSWKMLPETLKPPTASVSWVRPDTLVWATRLPETRLRQLTLNLLSSSQATLLLGKPAEHSFQLSYAGRVAADSDLGRQYPYLRGQALLHLEAPSDLPSLLSTQLLMRASEQGQPVAEEGLQLALLLDQSQAWDGPLGVRFESGVPHFRLWAPTARQVNLMLFDRSAREMQKSLPLKRNPQGVWELVGESAWTGQYYLYEVQVYSPLTGNLVTNWVTDPYSVSLAANSSHSQILNLADPALKPAGWDDLLQRNPIQPAAPEDMVIYELHLRDFSSQDQTVPAPERGKFTAFTHSESNGMRHLSALAAAGLTHVHLLPVFDLASVEEVASAQVQPAIAGQAVANSEQQQAAVAAVRNQDAYNWGYDPWHYGVPEGSYSSEPQGSRRILEFRQMVQALARTRLGVIMDVVYNHTQAWGQQDKSVLDKIVPGYYYRLDDQGQIQQSTCCPDTASEHRMMEKLMIDTLLRWAREYKVSGFRFDLMGHHTSENLRHIRQALDSLTLAGDGIDGKKIYLYGEGWKFGSLDARLPDLAMNQTHAAGLGVGMFNDRFRDSARGGNFDHATRSDQGWLNGLFLDPNHSKWNSDTPATAAGQRAQLLNYTSNVCLGMAGGLKDFVLTGPDGKSLTGSQLAYRGQPPAGFTADPQESISYVSAHDNYSLWDQIAAKAPYQVAGRQPATATPQERRQMQLLGISTVLLGQGVPLLDAGVEILRSKSGDGDSYDSGDWFNALDWTYRNNGWGRGLPVAWRNGQEWDFWRPRLSDPAFLASRADILASLAQVHRLLSLRKATPLLRLRNGAEIRSRVHFLNAEAGRPQIPGLIAMLVNDAPPAADLDPQRARLLVLLNPAPTAVTFVHPLLKANWRPFQIQQQAVLQRPVTLPVEGKLLTVPPLASSQADLSQLGTGQIRLPARSVQVLQVDQ